MVVIGQNPGREEDADGRPFIGASGKLLRNMLAQAGVDVARVYFTNAVKCWTPDNRKPELTEIKACRPYLELELAALAPKVIVVLGECALQALLSKKGISHARGQVHYWRNVPVIATFHPAYALRSPQHSGDLQSDLNRAATFLAPGTPAPHEWSWGQEGLDSHDYRAVAWSYDIETNGKELGDPDLRILLLGIYDGKTCVVYGPNNIRLGVQRLVKARQVGVRVVGHNAIGFDAEYLCRFYKEYIESDDTMILAHVIDENTPLGLEQLACTYLGVRPWKAQVTWDWSELREDDLKAAADYNAEDAVHTWDLANKLFALSKELGTDRCYDIMKKGTIVFEHHVNHNGIAIDVPRLRVLRDELHAEAQEAGARFQEIVGHKVNISSPQQVAVALYKTLDLAPPKYTSKGKPSTDEESLKELILARSWRGDEPAKAALDELLKARKSGKLATMLKSYESHAVQTGGHWRIYPRYFTWRTTTHRSTADKGFHQWPHNPQVRGLLTAAPGHVLLAADYSQLQMRIAAQISGSPQMRRLFSENIDPHTFIASKITGKRMEDVLKEERYVAKPVNFALLFGAEPFTLRVQALKDYNLVLSEDQARVYHDIFHDAYRLDAWYARVARELRETGMIRSPLGGIRHLPNIYAKDQRQRNEALRQAINAPVQDLEVMIAYLAMWEAYQRGLRIVAFLHDAIYVEAPEDCVEEQSNLLREIMENGVPAVLSSEYAYPLCVPLRVDIERKTC
jgi:uracil-DNA glycosylase family 4